MTEKGGVSFVKQTRLSIRRDAGDTVQNIRVRAANGLIYPSLPGRHDFRGLRIGGNGMGNCFFSYFHAVVMADKFNRRLIAPTWWSVKLGPLLRREVSLRRYGTMFKPHPDEITGAAKAFYLLTKWQTHHTIDIDLRHAPGPPHSRRLTVVESHHDFTYEGLHSHRDLIRSRLLEILHTPMPRPHWGASNFVAAHIRLGDFIPVETQGEQIKTLVDGLRIPLSWYVKAIKRSRELFPDLPVYIFSDGHARELAELLAIDGVSLRREPSDIADLLKMSESRLLIGSNSTFSRWATFLGNMPSVWLKTDAVSEQPSSARTPIFYVLDDFDSIKPNLMRCAA